MDRVKRVEADRLNTLEILLREKESGVTTPRSLLRRKIVRTVHCAVHRQKNKGIVCEWGCGVWLSIGRGQIEHQLKTCTKRYLECPQGCDKRMSEEAWLQPYKKVSDEEIEMEMDEIEVGSRSNSIDENDENIGQNSNQNNQNNQNSGQNSNQNSIVERSGNRENNGKREKKVSVTVQEHHELKECPYRLVRCPFKCTEMIRFNVLEDHMKDSCVKRPALPSVCRLGCGEMFGGTVGGLIEAEEDLFNHETEECIFRQVEVC